MAASFDISKLRLWSILTSIFKNKGAYQNVYSLNLTSYRITVDKIP